MLKFTNQFLRFPLSFAYLYQTNLLMMIRKIELSTNLNLVRVIFHVLFGARRPQVSHRVPFYHIRRGPACNLRYLNLSEQFFIAFFPARL